MVDRRTFFQILAACAGPALAPAAVPSPKSMTATAAHIIIMGQTFQVGFTQPSGLRNTYELCVRRIRPIPPDSFTLS